MDDKDELIDNKQVIFKAFTSDRAPVETDMEIKVNKTKLKAPKGSNSFLVNNLYLSCDPYMRGRMRQNYDSKLPPFVPGKPLEGFGVSKVIDSDDPDFKAGDLISGITSWEEYSLLSNPMQMRRIKQDDDIPLSYYVGLLGMYGYMVFLFRASENLFKVLIIDLLKNKLGFDEAFNYKEEPDLNAALKRYFREGIDIYFDNVGGSMLDAALLNMRYKGRIGVCGMVSLHSLTDSHGIHNSFCLIQKSITMRGFLQTDFLHLYPEFLENMISYYKEGKIVYIEDMNEGLESAPAALAGLFTGKNVGKQVIRVARE
ncbi:hypothetical protein ACFE04_028128 [Oxalis oulophora]